MEHVVGRPVKYTTYSRHGCRCDGCTLAAERAFKFRREPVA